MGKRTVIEDIGKNETTDDEVREFNLLKNVPGWQLYVKRLDEIFDVQYNQLRHVKKDEDYYKLQGKLEGIELCLTIIDKLIQSHEVAHSQS
jgi:hypothetical protein